MSRILVVARTTAVELLRRRTVVALMVAVPLAFYLARHDLVGVAEDQIEVGGHGVRVNRQELALTAATNLQGRSRALEIPILGVATTISGLSPGSSQIGGSPPRR